MNTGYFKVRAKARKSGAPKELKGIAIIFIALLLLYCLVIPSSLGLVGRQFKAWFFIAFGQTAFVLPFLLIALQIELGNIPSVRAARVMLS